MNKRIGILIALLIFLVFFYFLSPNLENGNSNWKTLVENRNESCEGSDISILGQDCSNNTLKIFVKNNGSNNLNESFVVWVFTSEMQVLEGKNLEISAGKVEEFEVNGVKGVVKTISIKSQVCGNVEDTKEVNIQCY